MEFGFALDEEWQQLGILLQGSGCPSHAHRKDNDSLLILTVLISGQCRSLGSRREWHICTQIMSFMETSKPYVDLGSYFDALLLPFSAGKHTYLKRRHSTYMRFWTRIRVRQLRATVSPNRLDDNSKGRELASHGHRTARVRNAWFVSFSRV